MKNFENGLVKGVHASRYIISWARSGGSLKYDIYGDFLDWLRSMGLSDDECADICHLASNGKMELETSAKEYLKTIKALR